MARAGIGATIAVVLYASVLTGCTTFRPDDVAEPKDITIAKALEAIGKGFSSMKRELDTQVLGVYPCKIRVSLNVRAEASDEGELVLGLASKPRVHEGIESQASSAATVSSTTRSDSSAERSNMIEIEMYNPGCLPEKTLGFEKPEKIGDAMRGMVVPDGGSTKNIFTVDITEDE